jgi:hypothetical protein
MRRTAGWAAFSLPLVSLLLGPWLAFAPPRSISASAPLNWLGTFEAALVAKHSRAPQRPLGQRLASGCGCRSVDVNLNNFVSDAKVKTGDAEVVNFNVTYVSASYGDTDVDVDQEAEAISGDAVAGQLIGVDARGPGCVNVRVQARNHVEDSTVQSGDATAINRSIVLVDPAVRRGDLEIEVEQEATAQSGDAITGQVIGITNAGSGRKGCGGVDLDAINEVLDTKVTTGTAAFYNVSDVRTCASAGCAAELLALLGAGAEIEVCSGSHCRDVDADELPEVLAQAGTQPDPDDDVDGDEDPPETCAPAPSPAPVGGTELRAEPSPQPSADPAPTPPPDSSETPAPSSAATPAPCVSPTPAQQETPSLLVPRNRKTRP